LWGETGRQLLGCFVHQRRHRRPLAPQESHFQRLSWRHVQVQQ
jgi:hypothetical protein